MKRRHFIKIASAGSILAGTGLLPLDVLAAPKTIKLVVLHTNDTHSRIDPFPNDGGKNSGLGGVVKRAGLIKKIRQEEPFLLLLDSGDIFQGTPYFNMFGGELEFKAMSSMKYDASTMGNHDFDIGFEGFAKQLPLANFPFLCSNYDFQGTILENKTQPYKIFERGGVRIGVFGLGIDLYGLVPDKNYQGLKILDPLEKANETAELLKDDKNCDLVICLSHLGYKYSNSKVSDKVLAANSSEIDIILGGHTHTFMNAPESVKNKKNKDVVINQVGFGGMILGRLDIHLERNKKNKCVSCSNVLVK